MYRGCDDTLSTKSMADAPLGMPVLVTGAFVMLIVGPLTAHP